MPDLELRVSVIPDAVAPAFLDGKRSKSEARRRIARYTGDALGEPLLIYVGTEIPRKNIPLLLHAFRCIKDRYPGAQLLKVGRPGHAQWRAESLNVGARLGLAMGRDVLFLEGIDDATLVDAYRAADVFVSASLYEGFGLPALEAMAVGTPVVVTDCGSFPEVVGEMGRVVEPDVRQFAQAVIATLTDPLSEERSLEGKDRAAEYTWVHAAECYLQVMEVVATTRDCVPVHRRGCHS